jgi:dolichol-phosphate mannosyltransferase
MVAKPPLLSVIVPTYNEQENIPKLIERLSSILRNGSIPFEIIVMDDDSPDGTASVVEGMRREYPESRCILRKKDRGLSPSVIEGFSVAKGGVILVMDADLSHPPEIVPKMYHAIASGEAEVAVGSRHTKGGGIEEWPLKRRILSWGAALMARPLTKVSDPMSGFFALKPSVVKDAPLKAKGYKILLEVLVKGTYSKVVEVPITFKDRAAGESKLGSKVMINYIQHLIQLYLHPGSAPFFKFLFVGGTGLIVDEGIFNALVFTMGKADDTYWQAISFSAAVVWNFIWNRIWTFSATKGRGPSQFVKFLLVALIAFGIRTGLYEGGKYLLPVSEKWHLSILLLAVIVIVTLINYAGSKLWAFRTDVSKP